MTRLFRRPFRGSRSLERGGGEPSRAIGDRPPHRSADSADAAGHEFDVITGLAEPRPERAIGVIYRPESELLSHYADAALSRQFDAWVWFDETRAVTPLGPEHVHEGTPETWPFGV